MYTECCGPLTQLQRVNISWILQMSITFSFTLLLGHLNWSLMMWLLDTLEKQEHIGYAVAASDAFTHLNKRCQTATMHGPPLCLLVFPSVNTFLLLRQMSQMYKCVSLSADLTFCHQEERETDNIPRAIGWALTNKPVVTHEEWKYNKCHNINCWVIMPERYN